MVEFGLWKKGAKPYETPRKDETKRSLKGEYKAKRKGDLQERPLLEI